MIEMISTTAAQDGSFTALRDALTAAQGHDCVIIGGLMVSILEAKQSSAHLGRAHTKDADLGLHRRAQVVDAVRTKLEDVAGLHYTRTQGHLFIRQAASAGEAPSAIDLLVPSYKTRHRTNVEIGGITTIEVPGLAEALNNLRVERVRLQWSDGRNDIVDVPLPQLHVALGLKLLAWQERGANKDAVDVLRCAQLFTDNPAPKTWANTQDLHRRARAVADRDFGRTDAQGIQAIRAYLNLDEAQTQAHSAKLRAFLSLALR